VFGVTTADQRVIDSIEQLNSLTGLAAKWLEAGRSRKREDQEIDSSEPPGSGGPATTSVPGGCTPASLTPQVLLSS